MGENFLVPLLSNKMVVNNNACQLKKTSLSSNPVESS